MSTSTNVVEGCCVVCGVTMVVCPVVDLAAGVDDTSVVCSFSVDVGAVASCVGVGDSAVVDGCIVVVSVVRSLANRIVSLGVDVLAGSGGGDAVVVDGSPISNDTGVVCALVVGVSLVVLGVDLADLNVVVCFSDDISAVVVVSFGNGGVSSVPSTVGVVGLTVIVVFTVDVSTVDDG